MAEAERAKDREYHLVRNELEDVRLDGQSRGLYEMLGNRFNLAPIIDPRRIADLGCGTGVVTSFMGRMYPDAQVYGIDLYPDPGMHRARNVTYVKGNVANLIKEHPEIEPGNFDYVFSRLLCFGMRDWPARMKDVANMLKPGGYYECQESGPLFFKDGAVKSVQPRWVETVQKAAKDFGFDFKVNLNAPGYMQSAGLDVLHHIPYKWPVGLWLEKDQPETTTLGRLSQTDIVGPLQKVCENLLSHSHSKQQMEEILSDVENSVLYGEPGDYINYTVTIGCKPL